MFYEESLYPPTVSLDDSCPPSETRALASVSEASKLSYVKQVHLVYVNVTLIASH